MELSKKSPLTIVTSAAAFILPVVVVLSNAGFKSLGFADAAEFAFITKIAGIAHPPGFPSYILTGFLWNKFTALFGISTVTSLLVLSAVFCGIAGLLIYKTVLFLLNGIYGNDTKNNSIYIALITALALASGTTIWHWSHSVEVYAFQLMAISITVYGIVCYEVTKKQSCLLLCAFGYALGLANHHLTMILFTPFLGLLMMPGWLTQPEITKKKNQQPESLFTFFKSKSFLIFCSTVICFVVFFYGWMMMRASIPLPFAFGSPDTFDRLFYHISGGSWIKNTSQSVNGIIGMRFPYFMHLLFDQFTCFVPFLLAGIIILFSKKRFRLAIAFLFYYLIILIYQLRIDQTADTDAYMVPAYFTLALFIPFGLSEMIRKTPKSIYLLPFFALLHYGVNYSKTDYRNFDLSQSLLQQINNAAPKGSVILLADWTSVITYNYFRYEENYRNDLIVLNYDLKFTHYQLLQRIYPSFYQYIKPEYDHYTTLLGEAHPEEIYNTGCTLDSPELMDAYTATVKKIQQYCSEKNVPYMADPKAYIFLQQNGLFNNASVSGSLVSNHITRMGKDIADLKINWINNKHVLMDAAAGDKLVDLEAALDFNHNYAQQTGDTIYAQESADAYEKIKRKERELKQNMPFLFRGN